MSEHRPLSTEDLLEHYMTVMVNNAEFTMDHIEDGYSGKKEMVYNERDLRNFARLLAAQALDSIDGRLSKILTCLETFNE